MITYLELQHGHLLSDIPITTQQHMEVLLVAINKLRALWGEPMVVTSGYRTPEDQQRINPSAPHSKHITGDAVDIADPDGRLYKFALANQDKLAQYGLWCEAGTMRTDGHGWLHCQSVPYGSYAEGKSRFFQP